MQQVVGQLLDDAPDVRRVLGLEVHVVDEDEDDAAGHVHRPPRRSAARCPRARQRAAPPAPAALKVRPPCTIANVVSVCATPSSSTVKSSLVSDGTKRPSLSRVMTSVVTAVTEARNVGCPGGGGACCAATPSVASARPRTVSRRARGATGWASPNYTRPLWNTWPVPRAQAAPDRARRRFLDAGRGTRRPGAGRTGRVAGAPGRPGGVRRRTVAETWCGCSRSTGRRPRHAARRDGRRRRARRPALHRSVDADDGRPRDAGRRRLRAHRRPARAHATIPPPGRSPWVPPAGPAGPGLRAADLAAEAQPMGVARHGVRRQQQPAELRPDERGRVGRRACSPACSARCRARPTPPACSSLASDHDSSGSRTSQPGASWVLPLDAIESPGAVPGRAQ